MTSCFDDSCLQDSCLEEYGWAPFFAQSFDRFRNSNPTSNPSVQGAEPARVIFESREIYRVQGNRAESTARLTGRLRSGDTLPAVGDWVAIETIQDGETRILALLDRRTRLSRKVAGSQTREQVVAANVDTVFLVMGLDGDFNLRRLERFAVMASESGAEPVVVLTKADICDDAAGHRLDAQQATPGASVFVTSSVDGSGLEPLRFYLQPGQTVALVGSSGAGKSTLINRLCGADVMKTGAVRQGDDRGRHTTTHRELLLLPGGGVLIDNPGVREIQLWSGDGDALGAAFEDIQQLAQQCRFRDCQHGDEPGCAVRLAVENGELDASRLENLRGLSRELAALERRKDVVAQRQHGRQLGKMYKRVIAAKKNRRGG